MSRKPYPRICRSPAAVASLLLLLTASAEAADSFSKYRFSAKGALFRGGIGQNVEVTATFEMGEANINGDREIRNLRYEIQLLPWRDILKPYVLRSDPSSEQSSWSDRHSSVYLNARQTIAADAAGTALEEVLDKGPDGKPIATSRHVNIYVFCENKELESCTMGIGWFASGISRYRGGDPSAEYLMKLTSSDQQRFAVEKIPDSEPEKKYLRLKN